jgi:hypothetical protein
MIKTTVKTLVALAFGFFSFPLPAQVFLSSMAGVTAKVPNSSLTNNVTTTGLVLNLDPGNVISYAGSGNNWADLSGNGYNGTLTNGPTFSSSNGGNIVFDGNDDVASFGNILNLSLIHI